MQSNNRCVNVSKIGSEGNSSAIIAYPGATCMIGLSGYKSIGSFVSGYGAVPWWTFSKFNLVSGAQVCKGWRIIGNTLTAPTGTGKTAGMEGGGWYGDSIVPSTSRPTDPGDMKILGNVLFQVGKVDASKYFHNIYINNHSGYTNANIEIGWNIIRDSTANRGVQIFSDGTGTADIGPGSIHDNLFYNLRSNPINLSNHATGTWNVYNNIIYHSGYGPDFYDGDAVYIGVLVDSSLNDATINFYNNIVYDVGKSSKPTESGCIALGTTFGGTLIPKNNIFYALSWQEYFVSVGYTFPSASAYNNLFYGSTDTFSWDTSALNADPQFVDLAGKDFHLITGSPAIDAGLDTTATVVYDYDGVTRPQNTTVDIGAYEQ